MWWTNKYVSVHFGLSLTHINLASTAVLHKANTILLIHMISIHIYDKPSPLMQALNTFQQDALLLSVIFLKLHCFQIGHSWQKKKVSFILSQRGYRVSPVERYISDKLCVSSKAWQISDVAFSDVSAISLSFDPSFTRLFSCHSRYSSQGKALGWGNIKINDTRVIQSQSFPLSTVSEGHTWGSGLKTCSSVLTQSEQNRNTHQSAQELKVKGVGDDAVEHIRL